MASRLATKFPPNVAEVVAGLCIPLVSNYQANKTMQLTPKTRSFAQKSAVLARNMQSRVEIRSFAEEAGKMCSFSPKYAVLRHNGFPVSD